MTIVDFLGFGLVGQVADSATALLGPGIKSRAERRVILAQDEADAATLQRRLLEIAEAQRAREADLDRSLHEFRERSRDARYPLGQPGRLRGLLKAGMVPNLLVSPVDLGNGVDPLTVARHVQDAVNQVDASAQMVRVLTGAFAYDDGKPREIEGNISAAEVARTEFSPHPAILVHFGRAGGTLTAYASVSDFFCTAEGDSAFETPVARISGDGIEYAVWRDPTSSDVHLEWVATEVSGAAAEEALGTAITLFALSISSVYWRTHGVRWSIKSTELGALSDIIEHAAENAPAIDTPSVTRSERLELELAELAARDHDVDVVGDAGEGTVVVYVAIPPRSVAFFLGEDFPSAPPAIYVQDAGDEIRPIALDDGQWEPSHSLTELLEALT